MYRYFLVIFFLIVMIAIAIKSIKSIKNQDSDIGCGKCMGECSNCNKKK